MTKLQRFLTDPTEDGCLISAGETMCDGDTTRTCGKVGIGELATFDTVFLDFYGTVAAGDWAVVLSTARRVIDELQLAVEVDAFAADWGTRFYDIVDASNHDAFRRLRECVAISLQQTLELLVGHVEVDHFLQELDAYWVAPSLHEDVFAFMEAVDQPICCVSNADTEHLLAAIEHHGLGFDAVVDSERVRSYKPDPAIFEAALRQMEADPARTLHIGDSLHSDIGGALKLGIKTAWLCRPERCHDIGNKQADFRISSLTQLLPILSNKRAIALD